MHHLIMSDYTHLHHMGSPRTHTLLGTTEPFPGSHDADSLCLHTDEGQHAI